MSLLLTEREIDGSQWQERTTSQPLLPHRPPVSLQEPRASACLVDRDLHGLPAGERKRGGW